MAEKKKGSLLGKIVLLLFIIVIVGVPAHMIHFGKFKTNDAGEPVLGEHKLPWEFSEADWKVYWGETKAQAQEIGEQAKDKWAELKEKAKEKWSELSAKISHKTDNTEKLFVNREAVQKELEALEATLPEEGSRGPEAQAIGYGIVGFKNALKEWEASLLWEKNQAMGSERILGQLDKSIANFTEAEKLTKASADAAKAAAATAKAAVDTAGPREQDPLLQAHKAAEEAAKVAEERHTIVAEMKKWAQEYHADFKARTEAIAGS